MRRKTNVRFSSVIIILFSLLFFPYLTVAGQPEDTVQCVEGNEPLFLNYGQHTVGCAINPVSDLDQIKVTASVADIGNLLRLNITKTGGSTTWHQHIEVWDPCGNKVIDTVNDYFTADLSIDCSGDFLVFVSDDNNATTGTYSFQVERILPVYAPKVSGNCANADEINHAADVDFFIIDGAAGTTIRIIVTKTGGSTTWHQHIEVWDPSGTKIVDVIDDNYSEDLSLGLTGEYLVAISDDNRIATGSYSFDFQCIFGPCPPNPTEGPYGNLSCSDGIDNDCDGLFDGNDPDCQGLPPPPKAAISPPSGYYLATQGFDFAILVEESDCSGLNVSATFDGNDVSSKLNNCLIPGTLIGGGESFRCPAISQLIKPGRHTFKTTFDFDNCQSATKTVTWNIRENTE